MLRLRALAPALVVVSVACAPPEGGHHELCYANHTCDPGLVCLSDVCVVPTQLRGAEGGPCYDNDTCNPGFVCADAVCVQDPTSGKLGGPCYANASCDPGLSCQAGVCEGGCVQHTDCPPTDACLDGVCADVLSEMCARNASCLGDASEEECIAEGRDFLETSASDDGCEALVSSYREYLACSAVAPPCSYEACEEEAQAYVDAMMAAAETDECEASQ